ncbi:MAG: hypothetical protein II900_08535 [Prevotella sp.]|nr:hypothetical protein [Prevotella sp.]
MKKLALLAMWILSSGVTLQAQPHPNFGQIGEVSTVIKMDARQKEFARKAKDSYLFKKKRIEKQKFTSDIVSQMYTLDKEYHQEIVKLLSDKQIGEYCKVMYTPEIQEQTNYYMMLFSKVEKGKPIINIEIAKSQLFDFLMKKKTISFKYKYDYSLLKKEEETLKREQPEILRFIKGMNKKDRMAANKKTDVFKQYELDKENHEKLIKTMSDKQIADYCMLNFAPEVEAKTQYRISLLTEIDNDYTDVELEKIKKDIFNYLMLEKIVYYKYKYDYAAQKENIGRLKAIQPAALKSSINNEKQKSYGKVVAGVVNWKHRRK